MAQANGEQAFVQPAKQSSSKLFSFIGMGVLAVALVAVGVLFYQATARLNRASEQIAVLETSVTSLQGNVASLNSQLTTEKASVADLQGKLASEQARAADLQARMTATQGDLAASKAQAASLQADLAAANAKVASLTADLATANGKVTTTQAALDKATADLAKANTDLAKASADLAAASSTLKKIQYPRHFSSLTELETWLARDDTNTNPAYAGTTGPEKCFILQVKALRDGFLLPASTYNDGTIIYIDNMSMIGGTMYFVNPTTDVVTPYATGPAFPSYPLPLP